MNETLLHEALFRRLKPLLLAEREFWQRRVLAWTLTLASVVAPLAAWWAVSRGASARSVWIAVGAAVIVIEAAVIILAMRRKTDPRALARRVESEHPELRGALLAALEQEAAPDGSMGFLQTRVFQNALAHAAQHEWLGRRQRAELRQRGFLLLAAAALFCLSLVGTSLLVKRETRVSRAAAVGLLAELSPASFSVAVSPGDAEVERGSRLVVEARFAGLAPGEASLVILEADNAPRSRNPMNHTVDARVFGGVVSDIVADARYRVEFEGGASETYRITTFEYPKLVRADVTITPPAWTGQQPVTVKNTMNFGVLEGSRVDFRVTVNKPLAVAELFAEDKTIVALKPQDGDPRVLGGGFAPVKSQKYRLHLVDDRERANKNPPWFTVRVLPNLPPRIDVTFPKRDLAVSPIQELPVEGKVWDDLGLVRAGATFLIGDESRDVALAGGEMAAGAKHDLKTLLNLEPLGAKPRQLVSYYLWAEDKGADGKSRRSMSDMFFAEVRHFEDIFREAEAPPGGGKEGGQRGEAGELLETQKQVVNATWRVLRDSGDGRAFEAMEKDVGVLHESQDIVKGKTEAAIEKVKDAEIEAALRDAAKSMTQASAQLAAVSETRRADGLLPALGSERRALEALQRAQSREHKVMQGRSMRSRSRGGQAMQQQLQNLELKQQDRRYEEQTEAGEESTAEQKENLQVLNRLKELAARQEALAQKMKDLEQQLQQAKTDAEREELARQLKRLQEEQEQLLRDLDSLQERMERPENLAQMSDMREKLRQAREQSREAGEQLAQQQAAQASASATKAQRQLEEARDEFRQRTAKRFADEMRQLKDRVRRLEDEQKKISETLEKSSAPKPDIAGDTSRQLERAIEDGKVARQLEEQQQALEAALEETRKITEAAEIAEPALSSALYEAGRKAETGGAKSGLEAARDYAAANDMQAAQQEEQKAAKGVTEFRENIERAAEKVLGSETEALRMARAELDKLMKELEASKAAGGSESKSTPEEEAKAGKDGELARNEDKNAEQGRPGDREGKSAETSEKPDGDQPGKASAQQGGKEKDDKAGATAGSGEGRTADRPEAPSESPGSDARDGRTDDGSRQQREGRLADNSRERGAGARSGADRDRDGGGWFFDAPGEEADRNPLTGSGYDRWSDRLRNVEELIEVPELRNQAAHIRENARQMRIDHRRSNHLPQVEAVRTRIAQPLAELRDRVAEELARRESANPLAPLDRDPVPARFRELVRRYYTELGAGGR